MRFQECTPERGVGTHAAATGQLEGVQQPVPCVVVACGIHLLVAVRARCAAIAFLIVNILAYTPLLWDSIASVLIVVIVIATVVIIVVIAQRLNRLHLT